MFLDTTFLVDFLRGDKRAVDLIAKRKSSLFFTSEINVFELVDGVYSGKNNVEGHLEKVFALLSKMIVLPFDRRSALKAGEISGKLNSQGEKIGDTDCLIAGVAIANGLSNIVTKNNKHFTKIKEVKTVSY